VGESMASLAKLLASGARVEKKVVNRLHRLRSCLSFASRRKLNPKIDHRLEHRLESVLINYSAYLILILGYEASVGDRLRAVFFGGVMGHTWA
jgi:hypothetical protein